MKVLYLATRQHFLETHAGFSHPFNITRCLAARGHDITLLMRPPRLPVPGLEPGRVLRLSDDFRVRFVDWRFLGNFISYPSALGELKGVIANRRPDILHERFELHGNTGKYLAGRNKLPFVLEANSPFVEEFFSPRSPLFHIFAWSRAKNFRAADRVVVQASQLRDIFSDIAPPEKIDVVSNGVDPALFDPEKVPDLRDSRSLVYGDHVIEFWEKISGWTGYFSKQWLLGDSLAEEGPNNPDGVDLASEFSSRVPKYDERKLINCFASTPDQKIILFVGSFRYWHGVLDLVESFPEVVREHKNTKLVLVGSGQLFEQVQARVRELEGSKRIPAGSVVLLGNVDYAFLPMFLKAADICVAPFNFLAGQEKGKINLFSRYDMWWSPLKIFEYMAMAKPVVTPEIGSLPQYLAKSGKFYSHGDVRELSEAIIHLLDNETVCREMGNLGRERACAEYSWEKKAEETEEIYNHILE